jgi:hypothetical protein
VLAPPHFPKSAIPRTSPRRALEALPSPLSSTIMPPLMGCKCQPI